jgi:hypothetical protein
MARSDDMTPELIAEAAKRPPAPEAEEILRRSRLLVQQEASGQTEQDVKPDPQREAVAATVKPSVYSETGRALFGGVRDAGQEVLDFVDDSANWLNDNFINLRTAQQDADYKAGKSKGFGGEKGALALPEVAKNETTAGNIARSVTQFAVPFLGYLKAFSRSALREAREERRGRCRPARRRTLTAFDPHQQRLSNASWNGPTTPGSRRERVQLPRVASPVTRTPKAV